MATPTLSASTPPLRRTTWTLEDLTGHYVETLRRWRHQFAAHVAELAPLGYDERFRRLWTLYLCYCEAGFAERRICDIQLLLAKPHAIVQARHVSARDAVALTG